MENTQPKKNVFKTIAAIWMKPSLIIKIFIGLIIGAVLGLLVPQATFFTFLGTLFVSALKAIAPVLVFILVLSSLATSSMNLGKRFSVVIFLYMASTFLAAFIAVGGSFIFPVSIKLVTDISNVGTAPEGIGQVLKNLCLNLVQNPIGSIINGNYTGVLFWSVTGGLALRKLASDSTKLVVKDFSEMVSKLVGWIIQFAPFGILGLVFSAVSENGLGIFKDYGMLLLLLVGCMLLVALVVDPLISFIFLRRNPYPLVFKCLRESGLTALFTRSSAANIPVNMQLCEKLDLDEDFYSVSIPLGATINMDGAAITITVMTLAAARTMGVEVDFLSALVLSILATLGACGASGVAGGSLLLIPMACSLFGISNDVAMEVVAVGFIIGIIQDSVETALNSSGDVMFTATADFYAKMKAGIAIPFFEKKKKVKEPQDEPTNQE